MRRIACLIACVIVLAVSAHAQSGAAPNELDRRIEEKAAEFKRFETAKDLRGATRVLEELYVLPGLSERNDVWLQVLCALAENCAQLGERERALGFLEEAVRDGYTDLAQLERESGLAGIRDDPRFADLVRKLRAARPAWDSAALRTAYRDSLGEDEKLAGLSCVWSEIRFGFANFEHAAGLDWDSLYVATIPRIRAARTTLEYYRVLQGTVALLRDGHTSIDVPEELWARMYSRPPVDTRFIEGRVIIGAVLDDSLRKQGISPGLEILKVDGVPVREYAESRFALYASASTPQGATVAMYEFNLLCGRPSESVALQLADATGQTFTRVLRRTHMGFWSDARDVEFRLLPGNIGYLALNSFGGEAVTAAFDSLFPAILKTDGLVIDVRRNTGGNSSVGFDILGCLTDSAFTIFAKKVPLYSANARAMGGSGIRWEDGPSSKVPARGARSYLGPVVVLAGPRTASAAEDFCVAFDLMRRGAIVGAPTNGSTGQPLHVPLPGGGTLRFCAGHCLYPDGREYVGVGVLPTLPVSETVRDMRAGRDVALEAGLERLKRGHRN